MSKGPTQIDAQAYLDQVTADTTDAVRKSAQEKRHTKGFRTARENLADLVDDDSFVEYGQLAVAAQRGRRDPESMRIDTAAAGVITGTPRVKQAGQQARQTSIAPSVFRASAEAFQAPAS